MHFSFRMLQSMIIFAGFCSGQTGAQVVAPRPPMGWNSYDSFDASIREDEFKAQVDYMSAHLAKYGWQYAVIDYCWSHPSPPLLWNPNLVEENGKLKPELEMDEYGRLLPASSRFPSATGGKGFKPLADYVHSQGLKFGIHVMRGIPRQAVDKALPVLGTNFTARDVADPGSTCRWLNHMYGVNMKHAGGQAYYDSIFRLYASWGVDYVKVDNIASPYSASEIEAVRRAIDKCGRPMVLSVSAGMMQMQYVTHVRTHANLWRISSDFWDTWDALKKQFDLCAAWAAFSQPGTWPDADMLPLGRVCVRGPCEDVHQTRFTHDEQVALLTLWSIFRSPLMMGGDLPTLDAATLALLTSPEVLEVDQNSTRGRQLFRRDELVAWTADGADGCRYLALFNLNDDERLVRTSLSELGLRGEYAMRDIWARRDLSTTRDEIALRLPAHGSGLLKLTSR